MEVAAVCVLYNPDIDLIKKNLDSIICQVKELWFIDNSETQGGIKNHICDKYERIHYCWLGENKGIAYALNEGCKLAQKIGYKWVLTLDQDSMLPSSCIEQYIKTITDYSDEKIGIVTCDIKCCEDDMHLSPQSRIIEHVDLCWTSGALTNLNAFMEVGGFNNELFIDAVDYAFCLALRDAGYSILKNNLITLQHQLGCTKSYKFRSQHLFFITNHNYIRRYYITRNYLWLSHEYGDKYPQVKFSYRFLIKTIFQILFFEADKMKKFISIYKGFKDFKSGKFGRYDVNNT